MFTVMTWNVENLFVPEADASQAERDRFDAKLALLAATIQVLDPDVIALQELGAGALAQLRNQVGAGTYPAFREGVPDDRNIRVGIFSKLAFQGQPRDIVNFTGPPPIDQIQGINSAGNVVPI